MGKAKDPLEKIANMIRETVAEELGKRDRQAEEAKDPAKRIEGMIDRAVAKQFEAFRQGFLEGGDDDKEKGGEKEEGGDFITRLFG